MIVCTPEAMLGLPLIESPITPDDTAYITVFQGRAVVLVGTMPPDERGQLRREARLKIRMGLADVLEWLGQPVINEPALAVLKDETHPIASDNNPGIFTWP